jgi:hypothetical protein
MFREKGIFSRPGERLHYAMHVALGVHEICQHPHHRYLHLRDHYLPTVLLDHLDGLVDVGDTDRVRHRGAILLTGLDRAIYAHILLISGRGKPIILVSIFLELPSEYLFIEVHGPFRIIRSKLEECHSRRVITDKLHLSDLLYATT